MAEFNNPLTEFEGDFRHDFKSLRLRFMETYRALDVLAHVNGSEHTDSELLYVESEVHGIPVIVTLEIRDAKEAIAEVSNTEGVPLRREGCDIYVPDDRNWMTPTRGPRTLPTGDRLPMRLPYQTTQTEKMISIILLLEGAHQYLTQNGGSVIAYEGQ